MNVLVLSCSTGEGHNSAANAIVNEFRLQNDNVIKKDVSRLYNKKNKEKRNIATDCINHIMSKRPKFFGLLYKAGAKYSATKITSPVYTVNGIYKKKLIKFVEENKIDCIVSTHLFGMECISHLKKHHALNIKCYGVATDYTCQPFFEETRQDGYFIPHKFLIDEFVSHGIPKDKIYCTGIPVDKKFTEKLSKEEARQKLNLDLNKKIIVIMLGGLGFGTLTTFCKKLVDKYDDNYQVLVIAGRNKELQNEIEANFKDTIVKAIPYTTCVNYYMNACDVLISKPGGLSSTEAAVSNVPLIHSFMVPGCETRNVNFFGEFGMSYYAKNEEEILYYLDMLLNSKELCERMCNNQSLVINKNAARDIVRIVKENERNK